MDDLFVDSHATCGSSMSLPACAGAAAASSDGQSVRVPQCCASCCWQASQARLPERQPSEWRDQLGPRPGQPSVLTAVVFRTATA